ncbi:MAG: FAD-binding oxidoreductase [Betaproteobacteria bacterium]|nr:FAD-binding oxidoreductase [Betaproteobacteria bacterium]
MDARLQSAFAALIGEQHVLRAPQDTAPYTTDWRKQFSASAECVLRPASTAEVAALVGLCAREGVAVVPQGGNTGLCGGSVPTGTRREVVLSLSRLNRIRSIDALNDTLTAEAGCVLAQVQQAAEAAGRLFALSLAAEGSCQIGGNLSTNAGGVNVLRYGNAREQVLGLEVVLPDGRVWNGLRALRKDNTGYDLKQLFLGAEGTLGVITAAVLRLHPKPTARATAWIGLRSPADAVQLLARLHERLGARISAFELVSRRCLDAVLAHDTTMRDPLARSYDWYVLAQFADSLTQDALRTQVELALGEFSEAEDTALASSEAQSLALWRIRESIPEAQFTNVKHDVSVPVSKVPELIARAEAALQAQFPGAPLYAFGHIGDGNIHLNVGDAALLARREQVNRTVYGIVGALGGSISAEHGIGQMKREDIRRHKDALELELMRAVKRALDPQDLMNPGKVL